jgi:protein TonB
MRPNALVASILIHVAVVGAFACRYRPDARPREPEPIYFEIIEEAFADESAAAPERQEEAEPQELKEEPPQAQEAVEPQVQEVAEPQVQEVAEPQVQEETAPEPQTQEVIEPQTQETIEPQISEEPVPEAPQSSAAFEHAAVLSPPTALNRITPIYPRSARRKGREGRVTLDVRVSPEGNVADATIVETSGFADLDRAALDAASSARFAPATKDDAPTEGCVRLTFDFKLK